MCRVDHASSLCRVEVRCHFSLCFCVTASDVLRSQPSQERRSLARLLTAPVADIVCQARGDGCGNTIGRNLRGRTTEVACIKLREVCGTTRLNLCQRMRRFVHDGGTAVTPVVASDNEADAVSAFPKSASVCCTVTCCDEQDWVCHFTVQKNGCRVGIRNFIRQERLRPMRGVGDAEL